MAYMKSFLYVLITSALLASCSSVEQLPNGETTSYAWGSTIPEAKNKVTQDAINYCSTRGGGVDYLQSSVKQGTAGDMGTYYLRYKCFDIGARAKQMTRQQEADRIEAERQRAIQAAQAKQVERERIRKEQEWERTRPQREAEVKKYQAEENARLNRICPAFFIARQSCATATFFAQCMQIRLGSSYSEWQDETCRKR